MHILMGGRLLCAVVLIVSQVAACDGDDPASDPCASGADAAIVLGKGVGGAFTPYEDGESVQLDVAPQGGFGVTVVISTEALAAGGDNLVDIQMDVEVDGSTAGAFLLEDAALLCEPSVGGRFDGAVVGFDPNQYSSFDDLLDLNGQRVDLVVSVTDADGASATARQSVTLDVGS